MNIRNKVSQFGVEVLYTHQLSPCGVHNTSPLLRHGVKDKLSLGATLSIDKQRQRQTSKKQTKISDKQITKYRDGQTEK